jgi:hemerythrin-like domain-containing protein
MSEGFTGARADAVELLTEQHREVDQLWSQLEVAHRDASSVQQDVGEKIVRLLSQHDAIETMVLYPALRQALPDGDQLADHSLDEHQQVREMLAQVDGEDVAEAGVFATLTKCIQAVQHHVQEEESSLFPKLRQAIGEERLTELGDEMQKAMATAPTHPHPHAPQSGVGATVAGAVSGVVDRARDAIRGDR